MGKSGNTRRDAATLPLVGRVDLRSESGWGWSSLAPLLVTPTPLTALATLPTRERVKAALAIDSGNQLSSQS
jgi:hypothetical protein